MNGLTFDAATILKVTLLLGEMTVKYGPKVAALWQRVFESGKLPTPEDYAETERLFEIDGRLYFRKES